MTHYPINPHGNRRESYNYCMIRFILLLQLPVNVNRRMENRQDAKVAKFDWQMNYYAEIPNFVNSRFQKSADS